jgi:hypothetical protein
MSSSKPVGQKSLSFRRRTGATLGAPLMITACALSGCGTQDATDDTADTRSTHDASADALGTHDATEPPDAGDVEGCPLPISDGDHEGRIAALGAQLDALVTKFEHDHQGGAGGGIDCPAAGKSSEASSTWGRYAFAKLARGTDAAGQALALSALSCMFTYQDTTMGSATYGVFRFHIDDAPRAGDNSTEFALEPVGWLLSQSLLPAATVRSLAPQIMAGLAAIDAHDICPHYTNICLMQQAIRLSIGAGFGATSDAGLATSGAASIAKAKSELEAWAASVKIGGVREFDSPTYGELDLEALALAHQGALLAQDAAALARVDGAIDYLWSDFSANVFASRGTLSPPYSRTYDFAGGQGILSYALWLEGLVETPWGEADPTMAAWLPSNEPTAHRPPASALCWSVPRTREVTSEWQQLGKLVRGRYTYLTDDYALGSATADYVVATPTSIQDVLVGGSIVSSPNTPLLTVLPDWLDAPLSAMAIGNFSKGTHLPLDPAVVQKEGALLVLLRVPAKDPGYGVPLVSLTTNLIAPAEVDALLVDGVAIDPTKTGTASARPVLVVQNGTGVMAMAVMDASGLDCVSGAEITETGIAHVDIVPAPDDPDRPAVRLAIRHLDAPPANTSTLDPCFARVALLMVGQHCDGKDCGAVLSSAVSAAVSAATSTFDRSTGAWSVTVRAPSGPTLHVARGTMMAGDVTAREVDGVTPSFVPLSVNGTALPLLP